MQKDMLPATPLPADPAVLPATESVPPNFDFGVTSAVIHDLKFSDTMSSTSVNYSKARQACGDVRNSLKSIPLPPSPLPSFLSLLPYGIRYISFDYFQSCPVDRGGNYARSFTY